MTTRPGYVWDATASVWVEIGQAAVLAPVKYQASQPSSPATGDIWIDSDEDVPSVDSTLYYRWTKTMSGGETSLSGTDNNSLALKYTPGYESVFINGVLQVRGSDYVATTGTTVTGLTALVASDVVMVESIVAYSVGDTYTQTTLNTMFSPITTTGLVLIASATIGSAVSSVTVSNAFSSAYDNYKVIINGGSGSSTTYLNFTLGSTSTGYYYQTFYGAYNNTVSGVGAQNQSSVLRTGGVNASSINFNVDFINPFLTKETYFTGPWTTDNAVGGVGFTTGYQASSTSFTSITLSPSSGTLTGGTIKVYGYK